MQEVLASWLAGGYREATLGDTWPSVECWECGTEAQHCHTAGCRVSAQHRGGSRTDLVACSSPGLGDLEGLLLGPEPRPFTSSFTSACTAFTSALNGLQRARA